LELLENKLEENNMAKRRRRRKRNYYNLDKISAEMKNGGE
jgi:hypothetical protein